MNLLNKDELYNVLKEPTLENFRILLQSHTGEEDQLDFKESWEEKEKTAKHILALANSGGGCIIFGVSQLDDGSFEIKGLNDFKDDAELRKEVKSYIPENLKFFLKEFKYDSSEYEKMINKKFQILIVECDPKNLPYICCNNGNKIKSGDILVRNGTESIKANNYQVNNIIERKLDALKIPKNKNMTLAEHLEQLKILYDELTYTTKGEGTFSKLMKNINNITSSLYGKTEIKKKSNYPLESYDDFILKVLNKKKKRIEEELDI